MATQKKEGAVNKSGKNLAVDASRFTGKAKTLASVINKWFGISPNDLQEGLNSVDLPQATVESLVGVPITILGFTKMVGEDKKTKAEREFLLVMGTKGNDNNAFVFFASQMVIMKKLIQASAQPDGFPVRCMIEHRTGKDQQYYDLVAAA